MIDFSIKQNDILPVLTDVITNDGIPVNLTNATIAIGWVLPNSSTATVRYGTVDNPALGLVHYAWEPGDTANPGVYPFEWHVLTNSSMSTFPRVRSRAYYRYFEVVPIMSPGSPIFIPPEPPIGSDMIPLTFETFEDLRNNTTLVAEGAYWLRGGMAIHDGSGGQFVYNALSFQSDNNFNVIKPHSKSDLEAGRYERDL